MSNKRESHFSENRKFYEVLAGFVFGSVSAFLILLYLN